MARLFDNRLLSILVGSAIAPGAKLYWYDSGTTTPATTYSTEALDPMAVNTNPVLADAQGRFPAIWLASGAYKYILTSATGSPASPIITQDPWNADAEPPTIDAGLADFLAGTDPLPIENGGTGENNAADALATLGALPVAGGTMTDEILRESAGAYLYNSAAGMAAGAVFLTSSGASDPTANAGEWWLKY